MGAQEMSDVMETETATEAGATTRMNMIQAINSALDVMMARDPNVIVMGEDVGYFGGVFRATAGLQAKHGKTRVFDTPITECGIVGVNSFSGSYPETPFGGNKDSGHGREGGTEGVREYMTLKFIVEGSL